MSLKFPKEHYDKELKNLKQGTVFVSWQYGENIPMMKTEVWDNKAKKIGCVNCHGTIRDLKESEPVKIVGYEEFFERLGR